VLRPPPSLRVFLCLQVTDMRRSFDSLALMATQVVGQDPLSGHLFVFRSRGGDRVKVLVWDTDGYVLYYKRLEEGMFKFPDSVRADQASVEVSGSDLAMLLDGVDLSSVRRQKRYRRPG